jgi:hypothetical protein
VATDPSVQRNFLLPSEQAEWLRDHAFHTRRPQAEIVREALADYRARLERSDAVATATPNPANRDLMERFRRGLGIDLAVLRDEDGEMWSRDT